MKQKIIVLTRKLAAFFLVIILGIGAAIPAMALTEEEQNELITNATGLLDQAPEFDWDNIPTLEDFEGTWTPMDTSSFYEACSNLDINAFGKLQFDINAATNNIQMLNMQYASMLYDLEEMGYGTIGDMEIPEATPGYSSNITDYFTSVYGDLSDRQNISASMPEGWTMQDLMKQASDKRDAEVKEAKESQAFTATQNMISLKNSLAFAQDVISTPALKSPLELNEMLKESSSSVAEEWTAKEQAGIEEIQKIAASNDSKITIQSQEDLQALFESNIGETQTWLDMNSTANIGSQKQVEIIKKMKNLVGLFSTQRDDVSIDTIIENMPLYSNGMWGNPQV